MSRLNAPVTAGSQVEPPGDPLHLGEMTWKEVEALDRSRCVALWALGATEAHGPHLPLATDDVIAVGMAKAAVGPLARAGWTTVLLPPLSYSAAPFAASFPGTVSVRPETVSALIADVAASLGGQGFACLGLANAHLDPAHLGSLHRAARAIEEVGSLPVAFPDLTRKPWGSRLTDEFKTGACHAGQYEGSVVLAARPELVREDERRRLPANPASLSDAIRAGHGSFAEAGGPEAYFGDPAAATAEEGRRTLEILGGCLAEAVLDRLAEPPGAAPAD